MISLILASWNRVAEPEKLLKHLDDQVYRNFEVIVADQNEDDRLGALLRAHPELKVKHLRLERGLSRARNAALQFAKGDIIAFPDDDCWYPAELLAGVVAWFEAHREVDVLFTGTRDEEKKVAAPKFPPGRGTCSRNRVLRCAVTYNMFVRAKAAAAVGAFREDIGPGTSSPYQSGEDIDYAIRLVECGFTAWYEPGLTVYHPRKEASLRKTHAYNLGVGYVLRLHKYPWWVIAEVVLRSLCGVIVHFCRLDLKRATRYAVRATGQVQGYFGGTRPAFAGS